MRTEQGIRKRLRLIQSMIGKELSTRDNRMKADASIGTLRWVLGEEL